MTSFRSAHMSWSDYSKDTAEYAERERRFAKLLARRNELRTLVKEKYPEVYELLLTYYAEKAWH
jgi:tmRNA-binding protein